MSWGPWEGSDLMKASGSNGGRVGVLWWVLMERARGMRVAMYLS